MSDPIREAEPAALARVRGAATLDELRSAGADLLGKKGTLTEARKQLGTLDPDARREAGKVLNEVWARITEAVAAREAELAAEARRAQLDAERLDLTESRAAARRGHLHLVTQARDRLED